MRPPVASRATGWEEQNAQREEGAVGFVVPRYQEHGGCQHLPGGADSVRSGCDRRAIATVIQVILR